MEEARILVSVAEKDFPESIDFREITGGEGCEPAARGSIFEVKDLNKIETFDRDHRIRYFYEIMHKNLKFFKAELYKLLPFEAYVHASMLDKEDIELDDKDLEFRIKKDMAESREIVKHSSRYVSI